MRLLEILPGKAGAREILTLARSGFANSVVEARNEDLSSLGFVTRGDERAQLAHRIASRPARGARVHGLVAGLQPHEKGE